MYTAEMYEIWLLLYDFNKIFVAEMNNLWPESHYRKAI